jgi:hypothetical protein
MKGFLGDFFTGQGKQSGPADARTPATAGADAPESSPPVAAAPPQVPSGPGERADGQGGATAPGGAGSAGPISLANGQGCDQAEAERLLAELQAEAQRAEREQRALGRGFSPALAAVVADLLAVAAEYARDPAAEAARGWDALELLRGVRPLLRAVIQRGTSREAPRAPGRLGRESGGSAGRDRVGRVGHGSAHVGVRGDKIARLSRPPTNQQRPRLGASWAERAVEGETRCP